MSLSMQSARAHLLSSNRAERSLVAAFGRSCPIHQRTRSLWDPAALFAGYVMLSFPFFISFHDQQSSHQHQAVEVSDTWARQACLRQRLIRPAASPSTSDQHPAHRKLVAAASGRCRALSLHEASKQYNLNKHSPTVRELQQSIVSPERDKRLLIVQSRHQSIKHISTRPLRILGNTYLES